MLLYATFMKMSSKDAIDITNKCIEAMGGATVVNHIDTAYLTKCKRIFIDITPDSKIPKAKTIKETIPYKHVNYQRVTPNSTCRPGSVSCQENKCFVMRREAGEFTGEAPCPMCGKNMHKHSRHVICPTCFTRNEEMNRFKGRNLKYEFTFGKYKGCTLEEVIRADVDYVTWLIVNSTFPLDNVAFEFYTRKKDEKDSFPAKRRN